MRLNGIGFSEFGKEKNLILTVNKYGEIIQFDIECQRITGFSREEAINKKIWDLLIPFPYIKQWKKMMVSSFLEEGINNIRIPWKTKQGNEVLIILNSFPFKDQTGAADNICFMGKKISTTWNKKQYDESKNEKITPEGGKKMTQESTKTHFVFTKPPLSQRSKQTKENNITTRKKHMITEKSQTTIQSPIETNIEELPIKNQKQFTKKIKELSEKYDEISKKQKFLMRSNRKLERKNKQLTKKIQKYNKGKEPTNTKEPEKQETKNKKLYPQDKKQPQKRKLRIGLKKKHIEYHKNIQTLQEIEKNLDIQQQKLYNERKDFDKRVAELSTWKQKLEQLEQEIEKRRIAIVNQEKNFREKVITNQQKNEKTPTFKNIQTSSIEFDKKKELEYKDGEQYFETITKSAGIIQRGIFKKINTSFEDLLGYSIDEIVDKSIIDFIAPEGLSDIENYYISQLKGTKITTLKTVLLSNENQKIPVEINFKPIKYKGVNAELMTITNEKK